MADDSLKVINALSVPQSISAEPSTTIEIQFNIRVDPASFTDSTFVVWGRWSGVHKGILDFNSIGTIAYFNPDKDFFFGEWITVSLSKGIKDEMGNKLSFGYAWNFWTITTKSTLDLTRTETIEVRQPGEDWIQTYGTYAGDLDNDGWSDFVVPNERPNDVSLIIFKVYDVLGNEIASLVNQELSSREYEVDFNAAVTHQIALSSGIYFYQLFAGESLFQTKKMILLK